MVNNIAFGLKRRLVAYGVLILWSHIIFQVVELRLLILVYHLLVAEGSLCLGIPVDHAQATVDESFVIEVDKYLDDTL